MTTISEALRLSVKSELNNVHTAMPGNIISYDYKTQKARIQPSIRRVYLNGVTQDMPILNAVPIIFPRSGDSFISFPVNEGDSCLIIFCERSIDQWVTQGGQVTPIDPRQFNPSDAVAIMGLYPFSDAIPLQNNDDFVISHAGSTITIKSDGEIDIKTAGKVAIGTPTTEVLQVLSTLMTYLQGAAVTGTTLGGPLNPAFTALVAPLQAQLDAIKGTIT